MVELVPRAYGKSLMQEIEWQNLKCRNCGAEMPKYPKYDNNVLKQLLNQMNG